MTSRKNGGRTRNGHSKIDLDKVFAQGTAIDRALRAAVAHTVLEHKREGRPIAEWSFEENRVVWTPAEEIPAPRAKKRTKRRRAS